MLHPTILHVDINSYFATILQQENPHLRGKPIGVNKDRGRTCLIATSKEAKAFGVTTGCRLPDAKRLCPHITTVAAEFDRCLDATKRLKNIFESIAPDVEIFSLDEAFINITHCRTHLYPDPRRLATHIQATIKHELGEWVTCSIGIGRNRFLAKIASEISPPDSVFEITDHNQDAILASVSFNDVCGVGYRLAHKLTRLGITNPYLLRFHSYEDLAACVGPYWAIELQKIAYGDEPAHLARLSSPPAHMRSVGRSITGYQLCDDESHIQAILYNLVEEVTYKVRQMNLAGRHGSIYLTGTDRWQQSRSWYAHRTLKTPIRHTHELFTLLYHQLYTPWQRSFPVIKFAVRLGMCQPMTTINPSLLPEWEKSEKISAAKDAITQKYGLFTLRSARLLNRPLIRPEVTGYLGDKHYQLRDQ